MSSSEVAQSEQQEIERTVVSDMEDCGVCRVRSDKSSREVAHSQCLHK